MKKTFLYFFALSLCTLASAISGLSATEINGEVLYKKHCSYCHPYADQLKVKSDLDVIDNLRNPPSPMPLFEKYKISDREAQAIASYIQFRIVSKLERKPL